MRINNCIFQLTCPTLIITDRNDDQNYKKLPLMYVVTDTEICSTPQTRFRLYTQRTQHDLAGHC